MDKKTPDIIDFNKERRRRDGERRLGDDKYPPEKERRTGKKLEHIDNKVDAALSKLEKLASFAGGDEGSKDRIMLAKALNESRRRAFNEHVVYYIALFFWCLGIVGWIIACFVENV